MKLQAKLLFGIVPAIAMGVLGLAWAVFSQLRSNSEEELLRQVELVVGQAQQQTNSFLDTAVANAELFARSTLVKRYIRVDDEEQRFDLMQPAILDLFTSYRAAYPSYIEIQLLMPDGYEDTRLAPAGRPNLTEEEADDDFFQEMAASDGSIHTAFLIDPNDGEAVFKFGQPIMLKDLRLDPALASKEVYGYLVVTAESSSLMQQIARERVGQTGYFFFVDDDGTIIEHPDRSLVGTRAEQYDTLVKLADGSTTAHEKSGERKMTTFGNRSVILDSTRLYDNLMLISVLPERELQAVSRSLSRAVAGVTIVTICLATGFFWLLLRSLVLSPLAGLHRTAIAIGEGKFEIGPDSVVPRTDEIGSLELAFRQMNVKLADSMTQLQDSYSRIHELAFKDSLTGLANRRQFLETLDSEIDGAAERGTRVAVLFLDLDDFKKVNDLLGHDAGDELLLEISRRLNDYVRGARNRHGAEALPNDKIQKGNSCIGRLGGDEFIVMLPDISDGPCAISIGKRLLASITRPIELQDHQFVVGSSIGISLYPDHAVDADGLVKCADSAMYAVKHTRKNGVRLYDDEMRERVAGQVRLESDLRLAFAREQFHLVYQPQICTRSRSVVGVEALLRWEHPERGQISPAEFIPAAEHTGLIAPLGAWVIDEACRQWHTWVTLGIDPGRIAINVSPRQFALHDLTEIIDTALARHGVPPRALEIEITESCMMEAPSTVVDTLLKLRNRGVRIAMDDFGTGHSSLALLASLPIDTLKIDRSFVTSVHVDATKGSIMFAVLSLARDLGLETVAEGVETSEELKFLAANNCDILQGFLLSRPMAAADATAWLMTHSGLLSNKAA